VRCTHKSALSCSSGTSSLIASSNLHLLFVTGSMKGWMPDQKALKIHGTVRDISKSAACPACHMLTRTHH
jgi:hypothetical protein